MLSLSTHEDFKFWVMQASPQLFLELPSYTRFSSTRTKMTSYIHGYSTCHQPGWENHEIKCCMKRPERSMLTWSDTLARHSAWDLTLLWELLSTEFPVNFELKALSGLLVFNTDIIFPSNCSVTGGILGRALSLLQYMVSFWDRQANWIVYIATEAHELVTFLT